MSLANVKWIRLNTLSDPRGSLTAVESQLDIPIEIKRIFYMHKIHDSRGGHAHINTDQVVIAMHGSFDVTLSTTAEKRVFRFDNAEQALFIPRLIFTDLYNFSTDAVCLVLANTHYDMKMSLRNWEAYVCY